MEDWFIFYIILCHPPYKFAVPWFLNHNNGEPILVSIIRLIKEVNSDFFLPISYCYHGNNNGFHYVVLGD